MYFINVHIASLDIFMCIKQRLFKYLPVYGLALIDDILSQRDSPISAFKFKMRKTETLFSCHLDKILSI